MAMHMGRSATAFSRALSRFAVAPPAARHISTGARTQASNQAPIFQPNILAASRLILIFSGISILEYWCDITGRWGRLQKKREHDRAELAERLKQLKLTRKNAEERFERREKKRLERLDKKKLSGI